MARIMQHEWMNSGACEAIEAEDEGITRVLFSEKRRSGVCDLSMSQRAKR